MPNHAGEGDSRQYTAFLVVPRVERQHHLIEQLRLAAPQPVPGTTLATALGVSVRTVERDVADLAEAGVPILVRRGPGGGYGIDARRQLPDVSLTPGEAAAIIVSLSSIGPYSSATARSAIVTLIGALIEKQPRER